MSARGAAPVDGLVSSIDRRRVALLALGALALVAIILSIGRGATAIPVARIFEILGGLFGASSSAGSGETAIVLQIRLPRTVLGFGLRQFATVEQIGGTTVFLCSPAADQVTGTTISVDGGWTAL